MRKKNIVKQKILIFVALSILIFVLLSCSLDADSQTESVDYESKEVLVYSYVDEDEEYLELATNYTYSGTGALTAKDVYYYEEQEDGVYLNTIVYNYTYTDGEAGLSGKQEYDYIKDYYDSGSSYYYLSCRETDYTYSNGTYSQSGKAEICYDGNDCGDSDSDTDLYANYTTYTEYDSSDSVTAIQTCTWITLGDEQYYQLERYYDGESVDASNLTEEYVCHYNYDEEDDYYYAYEMVHFSGVYDEFSEENEDEIYYYTVYSRNSENEVYSQIDYNYNVSAADVDSDGLFIDTDTGADGFDQDIVAEKIGAQETVLAFEYDSSGNRTSKTMSTEGEVVSITKYSYDDDDNLTSTSYYVSNGDHLKERETVVYSETYDDDGNYCYMETICTYDYGYSYTDYEDLVDDESRISGRSLAVVNKLSGKEFSGFKQNHRAE